MPATCFVDAHERVLYHATLAEIQGFLNSGQQPPSFEMAGPRQRIFFDPSNLKCGIVTCGGLCPGLNDVIRSIVLAYFIITELAQYSDSHSAMKDSLKSMGISQLNSLPT